MYYRRYSDINKNIFLFKAIAPPNSLFWFDGAFQDRRKLFFVSCVCGGEGGGGLVKMSATVVGRRRTFLKSHWLKAVSKNEICTRKCLKASYLQFSYFRFSGRKSQNQQKLAKKQPSFYNTVLLKNPHSFYEPRLTQHYKKYTPTIQPKTWFWLVSVKAFALHQTPKICILGALGKQVSFISLQISFWKFLFQRRGKLLTGGGWIITYRYITDWDS